MSAFVGGVWVGCAAAAAAAASGLCSVPLAFMNILSNRIRLCSSRYCLQSSSPRRLYYSASSAAVDDYSEGESVGCGPRNRNEARKEDLKVLALAGKVCKSLNWGIAWRIRFRKVVGGHGFDLSMAGLRVLVHVFAEAGMREEVYALLRDVVRYYEESNLDMSGLAPVLIRSINRVTETEGVFDVLIKVFAANSRLDDGVDLYMQCRRIGLRLSVLSCNFLLKCLVEGDRVDFVERLFVDMRHFGPAPNVRTYSIMLNFYSRLNISRDVYISRATDILSDMEARQVIPTVVTYSAYIRGLCKVGYLDKAFHVLQKSDHALNSYCWNALLHGYCEKNDLSSAQKIFDKMKEFGFPPDVYSYSILIDGYCRMGNVDKGCILLDEMELNNMKPALVTYSSMIHHSCRVGQVELSMKMFYSLRSLGYEYDNVIYDILLNGFGMRGYMELARGLFGEMRDNGVVPCTANYNSLIRGFCQRGQVEEALETIDTMMKDGVRPDVISFNVIAHAYCKSGHLKDALELLSVMGNHGIIPSDYTYGIIIRGLCKQLKPERAWTLLPSMVKRNILPNAVIGSILMDGFAKKLMPKRALNVYSTMVKAGIKPDQVMYTICINIYCYRRRMEAAYAVFREMIQRGFQPDHTCCTSIVAGYIRNGDINKAYAFLDQMSRAGVTPNIVTYTCMIDGLLKKNRRDLANILVDQMRRSGVPLDATTYSVLIGGCLRDHMFEKAEEIRDEMAEKRVLPDDVFLSMNSTTEHPPNSRVLVDKANMYATVYRSMVEYSDQSLVHGRSLTSALLGDLLSGNGPESSEMYLECRLLRNLQVGIACRSEDKLN